MNNNLKILEFYKSNNFIDDKDKFDEWLYYLLTTELDISKLIDDFDNFKNNDAIPNFIWKKYYYDMEFKYEFDNNNLDESVIIYKLIQELCEINMSKNLDYLKYISHKDFIKKIEERIIGINEKEKILNNLLEDEGNDESILLCHLK